MLAYGNVVIFFRILLDHYYNYLTAAANSIDQFNLSTIRNSLVTRQVSMKVRKHIIANDIFFSISSSKITLLPMKRVNIG